MVRGAEQMVQKREAGVPRGGPTVPAADDAVPTAARVVPDPAADRLPRSDPAGSLRYPRPRVGVK
ncbi:hypothetical protein Shyhy01_36190 [Streptomyces hygroscopicus subsp. hygroscopicus]|nr:hypothetical protein Shyhy01_36190 [Streptomyces hygroscopicus subsp. hygroscopicus]